MFSAFIIPFRESLEAGVIVGLLFSILFAFKAQKTQKYVWAGVAAGVIASLLFAWIFNAFMGGFTGKTEKLYEGILMLLACGLITHMVFWMKSISIGLRQKMTEQVSGIIQKNTLYMLSIIAFLTVVREGVETVIFFEALNISIRNLSMLGAALFGVSSAVALSYVLYKGSTRIDTRSVFQISGIFLLFIAGGLLAHGIVELQGAGVVPTFIKPFFDLSGILSEQEGVGSFLKALFGYDANPSFIAFVGYALFIPLTVWFYTRTGTTVTTKG